MSNHKKTQNIVRTVFFISILAISVLVLMLLPRLSIPLGIAYVMALMLRPIRPLFIKARLTKRVFIIISLAGLGVLFVYPITEVVHAIRTESENIQQYIPKLEAYANSLYLKLQNNLEKKFGIALEDTDLIGNFITELNSGVKKVILTVPKYLTSFLEWSLIIPLFLFFILKDGKVFKRLFLKIIPNQYFERTYYLFHQFNKKFGDYIFAKFMEASILGVIITTGLLIIGYPFAVLLGLLAALTNVVPYLGPILGFVPALVVGLVDNNTTSLGAMVVLYLIANIVDLAFVFPLLVSKIVNLHPVLVVISVIVGSQFAGVLGMVISIPMAALFKLIFLEIYKELYSNPYQS
jgi:putative permease